jgi:hypothetical protein
VNFYDFKIPIFELKQKELRKKLSYQNLIYGPLELKEEIRNLIIKELEITTADDGDINFKIKNLQGWLEKFEKSILDHNRVGRYLGNVKDLTKEVIKKEGFKDLNIRGPDLKMDYKIKRVNDKKNTQLSFDLIGNSHIFYIISERCRARTIAQILASWQYFLETENKRYKYIVIAREFGQQFLMALRSIGPLGIEIYKYRYHYDKNGFNYEKF